MKKSSVNKGLIFVFLILAIIGSALIYYYTRENMNLKVYVYDYRGPVEGALVKVNDDNKMTMKDGSADFGMLVKENETLDINVQHNEYNVNQEFEIDSIRYITGYTVSRVVLE